MTFFDDLQDRSDELKLLKALEVEMMEGADAALIILGPPTTPILIRESLAILIRADRYQEAAALLRTRDADEKWVDLAANVFAAIGEIEHAISLLAISDRSRDRSVMRSTHLAFAAGVLSQWQRRNGKKSLLAVSEWSDDDRELARTVLDVLEPLNALVHSNRGIQGEIEETAVCYSIHCSAIRDDFELLRELAAWLIQCRPLPLFVAELCLRRLIDCPDDLVARLRLEHPGDFQAAYLAAHIDCELCGHHHEAFEAFARLADVATNDAEKESVCIGLFETSGLCGVDATDRAIEFVQRLRSDDSRLLGFLRAGAHLGAKELVAAKKELEALQDHSDGLWWQLWAQLCVRSGDEEAAEVAWKKASELVPHPELIRLSVQASFDRRQYQSAAKGLQRLLKKSPNDERLLQNLSGTLVRLGDFGGASDSLKKLVEIAPANVEYRIGLAQCFARSNRPREGISFLRPVCESDDPPLNAFLLQSELLASVEQNREALDLLRRIAADHWDEPRFLLSYMKHAHAAGDDRLGSEIFVRLAELRHAGKVPSELMQETNLEQLLEHVRESQSRREALHAELVKGRLPWLWVEQMLGNTPVWAWTLRTQEMSWLSEERLSRAAYCVYSTNGFLVRDTADGRQIEVISPPPSSTGVVVDLSALLTLHRLKRLEAAASHFGKLTLPASYGDLRVEGKDRFGLHQASQEQQLNRIRQEIDKRRIQVVEAVEPNLQLVNEYLDASDGHAYRLRDLIEPLRKAQRVDTPAFEDFLRVAHQVSASNDDHPSITLGERVLIDLTTLRTLAGQAVFSAAIENLSVHILAEQERELTAELNAFATARSARAAHDEMWELVECLCEQKKLEWMSVASGSDAVEETDDLPEHTLDLDALKLARATGKPLLADDRVLQILAVHKDSKTETVGVEAFGSDMVLEALHESGNLNDDTVATDMLSLMRWRYRFLMPSRRILKQWANRSKDNLPGNCLLTAANYLHDCLRDPGLHCGFESTNPPVPIAVRFVTRWINHIVEMLAE